MVCAVWMVVAQVPLFFTFAGLGHSRRQGGTNGRGRGAGGVAKSEAGIQHIDGFQITVTSRIGNLTERGANAVAAQALLVR